MKIHCNAFAYDSPIPEKYSCKGDDVNPALSWDDVPPEAKSLALSIKDPDAPNGTFVHWLVYDIDKNLTQVAEDSIPGKQVVNSFGKNDYGGPCPPSGEHRYFFKVYALDTETLGDVQNIDEFEQKVEEHAIETAELMGRFAA